MIKEGMKLAVEGFRIGIYGILQIFTTPFIEIYNCYIAIRKNTANPNMSLPKWLAGSLGVFALTLILVPLLPLLIKMIISYLPNDFTLEHAYLELISTTLTLSITTFIISVKNKKTRTNDNKKNKQNTLSLLICDKLTTTFFILGIVAVLSYVAKHAYIQICSVSEFMGLFLQFIPHSSNDLFLGYAMFLLATTFAFVCMYRLCHLFTTFK